MSRSSIQQFRRVIRAAMLGVAVAVLVAGCASAPARSGGEGLTLERRGLGFQYSLDGSQPERVLGWVTYNPSFLEALADQPAARAEAERAVPFHYAGTAVAVAGSIYTLAAFASYTSSATSAETLGDFGRADAHSQRMIGGLLLTTIGMAALSIPAGRHMRSAVEMYNAGRRTADPSAGAVGRPQRFPANALPRTVHMDPVTRRVEVGWTVGAGWAQQR